VLVRAVTEGNARSIVSSANSVGLEGVGVLVGRLTVAATLGDAVGCIEVGLGASAAQATSTQAVKAAAPRLTRPTRDSARHIVDAYQMIMSEW
jgi:hypothetical protein